MVDLQCVSFECAAKGFSYTYIYIYIFFFRLFSIIDYYKTLNIVPCPCLFILYVVVCIC